MPVTITNSLAQRQIRNPVGSDAPFTPSLLGQTVLAAPGTETEPQALRDILITEETGALYDSIHTVEHNASVQGGPVCFESADPGVATVDAQGRLSWVSDGTARILVRQGLVTRRIKATVQRTGGAVVTRAEYAPGSFGKACMDTARAAITGKSAQAHRGLFSTVNHAYKQYILNPSRWCTGWDLSGVPVWNARSNSPARRGIPITRRHLLCVNHYSFRLQPGDRVRWRVSDGTVLERTVQFVATPQGYRYPFDFPNIALLYLDTELPPQVPVYPLPPENFREYLTLVHAGPEHPYASVKADVPLPVLVLDRFNNASIAALNQWAEYPEQSGMWLSVLSSFYGTEFDAWWRLLTSGDSGSPVFLYTGTGLPILLGCATYSSGGGSALWSLQAEIDALLADLATQAGDGSYLTPTIADLSAFDTYPEV